MTKKKSPPLSVRLSASHLKKFNALALEHGGRGKAICWLIDQLRQPPSSPAPPAPARPAVAPAPRPPVRPAVADSFPTGMPAAWVRSGLPVPCSQCGGPTKALAAPGGVECFRCGWRGTRD